MNTESDSRRRLPAVDAVLRAPGLEPSIELYGRRLVTVQVQRELENLRLRLQADDASAAVTEQEIDGLPSVVARALKSRFGAPLKRVINATGIFLHTNLGRAPLPRAVTSRVSSFLDAYCDLEYRLDSGKRGDRNVRVNELLRAATGAEAGMLVNNNAAALVLILSSLASGQEVVVSRGELVEIGGSFRIPDILTTAGVQLVEVGTTNRTRTADYENAISEKTGLLLKVYPSNYRQIGFTAEVPAEALMELGQKHGIATVVDEGSGLLRASHAAELKDHPSLSELVEAGCDLACGSGDKLLGGPQAGLIVGKQALVEKCHRNPLYRALRPDRFTFAGIEDVLRLHLADTEMPLARLWSDPAHHRRRLEQVASQIGAEIVPADAFVGGGAAPERPIVGEALALGGRQRLLELLRKGTPPLIGYLREGRLILDLRTVDPVDDEDLVVAIRTALNGLGD